MAKRQDGGIRLRPVGTRKHRQNAPAYSPAGTGCPAFEQAVENLYKGQNEESFWTLMGALNYALEMETHVLVPLRTALTVHNTPAPWTEHPVPTAKAKDLQLWTLRNEKGRTWLPMFTSAAAANGGLHPAGCHGAGPFHLGDRRRGAGPVEPLGYAGRRSAQRFAARGPYAGRPR